MSYADFMALGNDLKALLIPILFFIIFFLYKIGLIVLKLHINDNAQDTRMDNLEKNCTSCLLPKN